MNILGLHLNFVECESFLESNSSDILALYGKWWKTGLSKTIKINSKKNLCQILLSPEKVPIIFYIPRTNP